MENPKETSYLNAGWKEIMAHCIDSKFTAVLQEIFNLHEKKGRDYGTKEDPLSNCRASAKLGVEPWRGVAIRRADKWQRQARYLKTGTLSNESFEDSLLDDAVYALIELILWRETFGTTGTKEEQIKKEVQQRIKWEADKG